MAAFDRSGVERELMFFGHGCVPLVVVGVGAGAGIDRCSAGYGGAEGADLAGGDSGGCQRDAAARDVEDCATTSSIMVTSGFSMTKKRTTTATMTTGMR